MNKIFIEFLRNLMSENLLNEMGVNRISQLLASGLDFEKYIDSTRITKGVQLNDFITSAIDDAKSNPQNVPEGLRIVALEFHQALDGLAQEFRNYTNQQKAGSNYSLVAYKELIAKSILKSTIREELSYYQSLLLKKNQFSPFEGMYEEGKSSNAVKLSYMGRNHDNDIRFLTFAVLRRPSSHSVALTGPFGVTIEVRTDGGWEAHSFIADRRNLVKAVIGAEDGIRQEQEWAQTTKSKISRRREIVSKDKRTKLRVTGIDSDILHLYERYLTSLLDCIGYYRENPL